MAPNLPTKFPRLITRHKKLYKEKVYGTSHITGRLNRNNKLLTTTTIHENTQQPLSVDGEGNLACEEDWQAYIPSLVVSPPMGA